ncbi:tape measure protein [Acinetobacter sp. YH12126]|nr:tape measure protein [Acinetobacter sp. YH12126]
MSGKNLTFKLILDGDSKGLVAAAKQSEEVTKKVFETIRTEAKNVQVDALVGELNKATKEISNLGDKSTVSASQLRDMSMQSQQMIGALNTELVGAQAELVELSQTKATPSDIQNAVNRVADLKASIQSVEAAFGIYEATATDAMVGVDKAASKTISEVQKFTSVDLTNIVSEAQSATRAIDSMGDGAVVSTKEVERIGNIGTDSINALERELAVATTEFKALTQSSEAVSFEKFNDAKTKVDALEDALTLTKSAFSEFNVKASSAMQSVTASTDKASNSAKQAGDDIYSALGIKPPTVINDAIADLSRKLEDFKANSKLPAEEVARVTQATEQEIARLKNELNGIDPAAQKANSGVSALSKGMDGAKFAVTALVGALATVGIGLGIRELAETADAYTNLSARINIATSEGGNFTQAMAGVHQVALMTNTSLDATAGLFTKVNDVGKQMGMTQQQSLDLVKTINMAIQTGGGSAQASEAAIVQLTQALQSGVLRGDEFNSIMEQAPGISTALAKSLGVTTGELRKMAENGELSAEKVIKALQDQSAAIEADYAKFPTTIGNALQKISTQWQILIGEMDQANGSSAAVANALSIIADNLGILKVFFDDVAEGVGYFTSKFDDIDPSTLNALRDTLTQIYENIKQNIRYVADLGETIWSAFTTALDAVSPVFNVLLGGGESVSGLTTLFNVLRMAMAAISDASFGLNIGLKVLLASVQFLAGGVYSLISATLDYIPFMGDLADEAEKSSDRMFAQAEKNMRGAIQLSTEHKWAVVETYKDINKTQEQKNAETVENNKATFAELTKQNEELTQKSKELATERQSIDAQLNQARKDGNQSTIDSILQKSNELEAREKEHATAKAKLDSDLLASAQATAEAAIAANGGVMDGVMQADLLTKGYIVTIDEAGKVSVQAGESAAQAAENARVKEEALKLAKDNVKKADEELLAYQKQAAVERVLLDKQIEEAKKTGDLNALASAQSSIDAINAKENELKANRDIRIAELNNATTGSGQVAESAYSRASAAAKLFGVDLDVSLNKVSKSFSSSGNELDEFRNRLSEAGVTGKQAGDVLYQAWEDWLSKAKSQVEIDAANAKMREFEAQGVFSTKQVELGIIAIKRANSELPDDLDETGKAFERLGIKTKEQLKLAAQLALADFELVRKSGQATQEDLQKAYEETIRLAYASGDAQAIAAANSKAASLGLKIQVDETGKASVVSMSNLEQTMHKVKNATSGAEDGFRNLGQTGRDEADSVKSAWEEAVSAASSGMHETRKGTKGKMAKNAEDIEAELKAMGYSDAAAKQHAKDIYEGTKGVNGYKSSGFGFFGGLSNVEQVNAELERMQQYAPNNVSTKASGLGSSSKSISYELKLGNETVQLTGSPESQSSLEAMLKQLGTLSKST